MVTVPKSPAATAPPRDGRATIGPPPPLVQSGVGAWSTGLCDCFSDVPTWDVGTRSTEVYLWLGCMTCWCPCITFGRIAEIVDRGSTSCGASGALYALIACIPCCKCIYSCCYRTKMRKQYKLAESPCPDCLVHVCCESCALCQEYRELQLRGFDMSIGWHGNIEKQDQGVAIPMPPFVQGGMMR